MISKHPSRFGTIDNKVRFLMHNSNISPFPPSYFPFFDTSLIFFTQDILFVLLPIWPRLPPPTTQATEERKRENWHKHPPPNPQIPDSCPRSKPQQQEKNQERRRKRERKKERKKERKGPFDNDKKDDHSIQQANNFPNAPRPCDQKKSYTDKTREKGQGGRQRVTDEKG